MCQVRVWVEGADGLERDQRTLVGGCLQSGECGPEPAGERTRD